MTKTHLHPFLVRPVLSLLFVQNNIIITIFLINVNEVEELKK